MVVREQGEIKGIQGIAVQENGSTVVSVADTVNIVGGGTVTDVGGVATINIPYGCVWYREDVPAGSASYTFVNSPATDTSFLVFTDSGTLMYLGIDYTYDSSTETITFLSLEDNEAAYIWVAHVNAIGGNVGDMVKTVYDPNNVQQNVYDYNYFINTPTIPAAQIQSDWTQSDNTKLDFIKNKPNLATVATSGDYDDLSNKPTIPAAQIQSDWNQADNTKLDYIKNKPSIPAAQIQSDWNQSDNTKLDYIKNKPTIPSISGLVAGPESSVDGNIVLFDGTTGKLIKDSGLNIQVVNTQPSGDQVDVYYDNGTIYLYVKPIEVILTENGDDLVTEDNKNIILEN